MSFGAGRRIFTLAVLIICDRASHTQSEHVATSVSDLRKITQQDSASFCNAVTITCLALNIIDDHSNADAYGIAELQRSADIIAIE